MKLYLSSYRLGNKESFLKEWAKKHDNRVLIIINAQDMYLDDEDREIRNMNKCEDLIRVGFVPTILDLRKYFNNENKLREDIKGYHAFYVIGGNTFILRRSMKLSGFDNYLKEIVNMPDYLYIGYSAGICVLAPSLHGIDLEDEPDIDPYNYGKIIWDGLGFLEYTPIPHYGSLYSPKASDTVSYMKEHNIKYKTLRDGEVIITDIKKA